MSNQISFSMQRQCQPNWCWTAVATSVAENLGNPGQWTQCSLAAAQLNQLQSDCCSSTGSPNPCDQTSNLDYSLSLVQHLSAVQPNPASGPATAATIKREIDGKRPIGAKIEWVNSGSQGHFVLVTGYDDAGPDFIVKINDPEKPDGAPANPYSLATLSNGGYQSGGSWKYTYFTA